MRSVGFPTLAMLPALAVGLYLAPLFVTADDAMAQGKKPSHRLLREGMFALSKIDSAKVVMLGDSLTEMAQWSEITGCHFVANRGIGADMSAGVLHRLDEVVKLKPSAVFLMIGINDVASNIPTDKIVANVRDTIQRLTKARAHVYLTLVLPVAHSYSRKINPKAEELNAAYKKLAERPNVSLVDFRAQMQTEDGFLRDELTIDGIHLLPAGYRIWRDAISPLVLKHCSAASAAPEKSAENDPLEAEAPNPPAAGKFDARFGSWN